MIGPINESGVPTLSLMATMLTVPPIQLPESAARPIQVSPGRRAPNSASATGPPMTIPREPASIMRMALRPSFLTARRSTVTISNSKLTGSRFFTIQPYASELWGVIPRLVQIAGTK